MEGAGICAAAAFVVLAEVEGAEGADAWDRGTLYDLADMEDAGVGSAEGAGVGRGAVAGAGSEAAFGIFADVLGCGAWGGGVLLALADVEGAGVGGEGGDRIGLAEVGVAGGWDKLGAARGEAAGAGAGACTAGGVAGLAEVVGADSGALAAGALLFFADALTVAAACVKDSTSLAAEPTAPPKPASCWTMKSITWRALVELGAAFSTRGFWEVGDDRPSVRVPGDSRTWRGGGGAAVAACSVWRAGGGIGVVGSSCRTIFRMASSAIGFSSLGSIKWDSLSDQLSVDPDGRLKVAGLGRGRGYRLLFACDTTRQMMAWRLGSRQRLGDIGFCPTQEAAKDAADLPGMPAAQTLAGADTAAAQLGGNGVL